MFTARLIAPLLALAACGGPTIGLLDPRPAVSAGAAAGFELELTASVADHFSVELGSETVRVRRWRETLSRGFENAGGRRGDIRLVARLERVELALETPEGGVALAHGGHPPPVPKLPARRIRAEVSYAGYISAPGSVKPIARVSGTVSVSQSGAGVADVVRGALEEMFERLIAQLSSQTRRATAAAQGEIK